MKQNSWCKEVIYNCILSYKEIESVVGYTFIDQNGIIDIFDNTNGMNIPLLAKRFEAFAEQNESRFNSIFDKTLNELKENNMEKTYQFIFYDYKNDQFYNPFKYVATDA